jgi:hypothetical protein
MATPPLPGITFLRKDDTHAMWPGPLMQVPDAAPLGAEGAFNLNDLNGISGDLNRTYESYKMFGSMIMVTVNYTDFTVAPGECTATISPPLNPLVPFSRVNQGAGAAAGVSLATGDLVAGEISPILGTPNLQLRLTNPTAAPITPDYGVQISFTYKYS